jgi:hypothetical protein
MEVKPNQFTLGTLFFVLTCVGAALGSFRVSMLPEARHTSPIFFLVGVAATGMAIGALAGKPIAGAVMTVAVFIAAVVFAFLLLA